MSRSTPPIWPILSIFFFSGAAGLAYEIVWARQLSLTLGVSVYAVSATLAAFMGGLGAGAELSGRMLDRGASPIRLYALCEALLGGYVLMFPLIWGVMDHAYLLLHGGAEGATIQVVMMRFLLAVAALAPPTLLMGATLPAIVRYAAVIGARGRRMAGTVYAINTAGAMVGTMAAGFALIEIFGLTNSLRIGAVVNLCCAAAAWLLAAEKGWQDGAKVDTGGARKAEEAPRDGLIVILYGVTGFCGLALELLWTRALILLLNNTTYAFSLVLSVFLFGTALGSALAARVKDRSQSRARLLFAVIMTSVGVMAMLSLVALSYSDQALAAISGLVGQGRLAAMIPGGGPMASALLFALVIIAPCTAMLGALFPLAAMALSPAGEKVGGDVGRLYAVNIVGCVAGSLAAGYYMIPWLGTQNSLILLAMTAVAAGMALAFLRSAKEAPRLALVSAVVILPIAVFLANNRDIAFQLSAAKLDAGAKVEFYEEGPSATVLVSRNDSDLSEGRKPIRRLWINGDPIAGTFREALQLERLQAHIPLLMINAPKTALVICFGTGSTAAAALAHGLESVTAVDISREVFHAGPSFTDGAPGLFSSPRFHMVEEDGRNYLKTTRKSFDFITAEPPPPSNAGVVSLYTTEYYQLARARLNPGGLLSQWIPIHHLSDEDLRRLVAAFFQVFPQGAMWYTKWDAIMIGAAGPLPGYEGIYNAFANPAVASSLRDIGIYRPEQILANHMMGPAQLEQYTRAVEPLADDKPVVEFTAPRIPTAEGVLVKGSNLERILELRTPPAMDQSSGTQLEPLAQAFASQTEFFHGQVARSGQNAGAAAGYYEKALRMDPENSEAAYALLSLNIETLYSAISSSRPGLVAALLDRTEKLDNRGLFAVQLRFLRGVLLAGSGDMDGAELALEEAVRLDPGYFMAVVNLAGLNAQKPDGGARALELYKRALELDPTQDEQEAIKQAIDTIKGRRS